MHISGEHHFSAPRSARATRGNASYRHKMSVVRWQMALSVHEFVLSEYVVSCMLYCHYADICIFCTLLTTLICIFAIVMCHCRFCKWLPLRGDLLWYVSRQHVLFLYHFLYLVFFCSFYFTSLIGVSVVFAVAVVVSSFRAFAVRFKIWSRVKDIRTYIICKCDSFSLSTSNNTLFFFCCSRFIVFFAIFWCVRVCVYTTFVHLILQFVEWHTGGFSLLLFIVLCHT